MIIIYRAEKNSDLTEGRGLMTTIAYFRKKEDAQQAAKGWGVMGVGDGDVRSIEVFASFKEYEENHIDTVRARALSKLTPIERKALGY